MPGLKPTNDMLSKRIDLVCSKIDAGERTHSIIRYLKAEFGLSRATSLRYVRLSRKRLQDSVGDKEDLRSEAYYRLLAIAESKTSGNGDKIRANLAIIHLLDLAGPIIEQHDRKRDDIPIEQRRAMVYALLRAMEMRRRKAERSEQCDNAASDRTGTNVADHNRNSGQ
jgi:hypothetical protein